MNISQPQQLPFLEFLGWQIADVYRLTQLEMLSNYERGWRYRDIFAKSPIDSYHIDSLLEKLLIESRSH